MRIEKLTQDELAPLLEGHAQDRARESAVVWRVGYGGVGEQPDHTLAYFGLIYTNAVAAEGFLWAVVAKEAEQLSTGDLRGGLALWQAFTARRLRAWTLLAYCNHEEKRNNRFLRWLGFSLTQSDSEFHYYVRKPNGH